MPMVRRWRARVRAAGCSIATCGFLTCGFLLWTAAAGAQGGGTIMGTVADAQGGVLPGVTLTLRNTESGVIRTGLSEGSGTYQFVGLPPGPYDLKAELQGFATTEIKNQLLTIGRQVKTDVVMIQALEETLTVTAQAKVIETAASDVSAVVTQRQIETVPVPTRQTLDLALLIPGTNTDGSVPRRVSVSVGAGGAVSRNWFLVDGVSNQQSTSGDPREGFSL